jgi:V/A-type H+-transporting ATPase subunit I
LGTIPKSRIDDFSDVLKKKLKTAYLERLALTDDKQTVRLTALKSNKNELEALATEFGFTSSSNINFDESIQSQLATHQATITEVTDRVGGREDVLQALAASLPDLKNMKRYLGWEGDKEYARTNMEQTSQTKTMYGWMPKDKLKAVTQTLASVAPTSTLLPVEPKAGEVAPIALKNRWWMKPFEAVTTLYGLPNNNEFDPTAALSPFFILFYALCLTDAGYGIILTLVFGGYLLIKKITIDDNPLFWLLFFSGIVTTLVGIPFGGWMGLDPAKVANHFPALTKEVLTPDGMVTMFKGQIWHLGKETGITFLQNLSLILGIVHLFTGMFLAGWHKFIHGKKAEAMWNDFTPHLLLGGILLYAFQRTPLTMWIMIATVFVLVWGKGYGSPWYLRPVTGAVGLLNFAIGMLTNSLSYLRILALGLVTGAIAGAVNQVAVEVGNLFPTGVDYLIIAIIFVGGHVVSVVLNALGSFIHSGRLQFIEFFGQFFEGGGKPFTPFKRS